MVYTRKGKLVITKWKKITFSIMISNENYHKTPGKRFYSSNEIFTHPTKKRLLSILTGYSDAFINGWVVAYQDSSIGGH